MLWPNSWTDQDATWYDGIGLGPGNIVLDVDPAPPQGHSPLPQFLAHVCCGQMAGRIKMPLGTKVGLVPGHMVKKQKKTIDSTLNKDCFVNSIDKTLRQKINTAHLQIATEVMI